ncbi:MAG: hypothetical protein Q4B29_01650 [Candidatus Saccharibacteria bacterium]|nr:hypothetical protein [Candidatus Saccharibacteria bacterium]
MKSKILNGLTNQKFLSILTSIIFVAWLVTFISEFGASASSADESVGGWVVIGGVVATCLCLSPVAVLTILNDLSLNPTKKFLFIFNVDQKKLLIAELIFAIISLFIPLFTLQFFTLEIWQGIVLTLATLVLTAGYATRLAKKRF